MSLDVQVTPTDFYDRKKLLPSIGNQERYGYLFFSFAEAVLNFHEHFPFLCASGLWPAALEKSRVQAHISDVIPVQNPT